MSRLQASLLPADGKKLGSRETPSPVWDTMVAAMGVDKAGTGEGLGNGNILLPCPLGAVTAGPSMAKSASYPRKAHTQIFM